MPEENGRVHAVEWPPLERLVPHSECGKHIAALRSALVAFAHYDEADRPCWCTRAEAMGGVRHTQACRAARAVFEAVS
jgi:hypothetical protein